MGEIEDAGEDFPVNGQERMDRQGIWLRQSVTFTVDGQTRTLEIALPLRPGASAAEMEALLDEAEAGMRRLTQRLNTRVAEILGSPGAPADVTAAPAPIGPPAPAAAPAITETHERPAPEPVAAPTPRQSAAPSRPTSTTAPERPVQPDVEKAPAAPSHPASRPQPIAPSTQPERSPAQPAAASTISAPPASATPVAELTLPEFLAEAKQLGLTPKQVMERLNVRSLSGLNLREALEALRRQMLRADTSSAPSSPAARPAPSVTSSAPAHRQPPATPAPVYGFDEEDDPILDDEPELTFTIEETSLDEEDEALYEDGASGHPPAAISSLDGLDELDELDALLADVNGAVGVIGNGASPASVSAPLAYAAPVEYANDELDEVNEPSLLDDPDDLDDEQQYMPDNLPIPAPPPTRPASSRTASPRSPRAGNEPATAHSAHPPVEPARAASGPLGRSRAMQIIGQLRGVRGGGVTTAQQRLAYRNIITSEIGDLDATNLTRLIWRISPDRLGAEQLDALIRWGKEDAFAEEVPLVITTLRAEREREAQSGQGASATAAPEPTAPTPPASARPSPRSTATPRTSASGATGATRAEGQRRPSSARRPRDGAGDAGDAGEPGGY